MRKLSNCLLFLGSRDCQRADWKTNHKLECPILPQLSKLQLAFDQQMDVLLLGRVMRKLQQLQEKEKDKQHEVSPLDLVWYEDDLHAQENVLIAALTQKMGLVDGNWSLQELLKMLSRFQCNNFSITDDLLLDMGAGIFRLF